MSNTPQKLSPSDWKVIDRLRDSGFVICVFTPDEVGETADPEDIEDAMTQAGWAVIQG